MNLGAINRFGLNGSSSFALVLATASIVCSASVSAAATRGQDANAPVFSAAYVTATATYVHEGLVNISGSANVYQTPTVQHAAVSQPITGTAEITAYVLRIVEGQVNITCTAEIVAVVASTQGQSTLSSGAEVTADATLIQPGYSSPSGVASVTIVSEPVVTRYVKAAILGTANLYVEVGINHVYEAHAYPTGTASIIADPLNLVMHGADVVCTASLSPTLTMTQNASALTAGNAVIVMAEPTVEQLPFVSVTATADVSALLWVVKTPTVAIDNSCSIVASASQAHAASVSLTGTASVNAPIEMTNQIFAVFVGGAETYVEGVRNVMLECLIDASAEIYPDATREVLPTVTLGTVATIGANATRVLTPSAALTGAADLAVAMTTIKLGFVNLPGGATMTTNATRTAMGLVDLTGTAEITADMLLAKAGYVDILGTAEIFADTVTNPASYDPDNRTFRSPMREVDFARPFVETEFRRAA